MLTLKSTTSLDQSHSIFHYIYLYPHQRFSARITRTRQFDPSNGVLLHKCYQQPGGSSIVWWGAADARVQVTVYIILLAI